jgi:hypothetical protein
MRPSGRQPLIRGGMACISAPVGEPPGWRQRALRCRRSCGRAPGRGLSSRVSPRRARGGAGSCRRLHPRHATPSVRWRLGGCAADPRTPRVPRPVARRGGAAIAACGVGHQTARSSADLTQAEGPRRVPRGVDDLPRARARPWRATFTHHGRRTPPCGTPVSVGGRLAASPTPALRPGGIHPRAGQWPIARRRAAGPRGSTAPALAASTTHGLVGGGRPQAPRGGIAS